MVGPPFLGKHPEEKKLFLDLSESDSLNIQVRLSTFSILTAAQIAAIVLVGPKVEHDDIDTCFWKLTSRHNGSRLIQHFLPVCTCMYFLSIRCIFECSYFTIQGFCGSEIRICNETRELL